MGTSGTAREEAARSPPSLTGNSNAACHDGGTPSSEIDPSSEFAAARVDERAIAPGGDEDAVVADAAEENPSPENVGGRDDQNGHFNATLPKFGGGRKKRVSPRNDFDSLLSKFGGNRKNRSPPQNNDVGLNGLESFASISVGGSKSAAGSRSSAAPSSS